VRVRACSAVCFDRPSSQNEHVSGNRRSIMCQFQYQIGHCEIAMDTSMTNPLSARITNKGRNWFARTPWLRRISLNSLKFSCSPAVGGHTFYWKISPNILLSAAWEYPRRRARNWAAGQHAVLRIHRRARLVLLLTIDQIRDPSHRNWPS